MKSGHTVAVDDAIRFLMVYREKMRVQDLQQRANGDVPEDGFKEADHRGILNPRPIGADSTLCKHGSVQACMEGCHGL